MGKLERVTFLIGTAVFRLIKKLITKVDFQYQTDMNNGEQELRRYVWYQKSIFVINFLITLQTVISITDAMWYG